MTEFFHYEDMTWDAVAALPGDTPLVLPLGWGYDFNELAIQLSRPAQIGLLPSFPFGWRRSGLEVPERLLFNIYPICWIACATMASRACIAWRLRDSIHSPSSIHRFANLT